MGRHPHGEAAMVSSPLLADLSRSYRDAGGGRVHRILECARAPGIHAIVVFRFGHWALAQPKWARVVLDPVYVLANALVHILWGIEISRRACIGPGLCVGHFGGITVSGDAVIGRNCALSQGTTIGQSGEGTPVIGDDVYIAPGARVFGKIRVGNNVKIGANAVIHKDVPDNAIVVLAPGMQIISYAGNRRRPAPAPLEPAGLAEPVEKVAVDHAH
jgi:serine O-acetyltransferase